MPRKSVFNIDALISYEIEPTDETKLVVNPDYRKIESQIKSKAAKRGRKLREFGEISLSPAPPPKEIQAYETRKGNLVEEIDRLEQDLSALKETRRDTCKHLPLDQLPETDRFSQFAPTRKAFVDTIKLIAYRAETAMAAILRDSLARPDDARALLRDIFTTQADIHPNQEQGTLTVRLHHLTNRLSDQAARQLAEYLNTTKTIYPGTNLRLCYELGSK